MGVTGSHLTPSDLRRFRRQLSAYVSEFDGDTLEMRVHQYIQDWVESSCRPHDHLWGMPLEAMNSRMVVFFDDWSFSLDTIDALHASWTPEWWQIQFHRDGNIVFALGPIGYERVSN